MTWGQVIWGSFWRSIIGSAFIIAVLIGLYYGLKLLPWF
jgi:hypothetical protein